MRSNLIWRLIPLGLASAFLDCLPANTNSPKHVGIKGGRSPFCVSSSASTRCTSLPAAKDESNSDEISKNNNKPKKKVSSKQRKKKAPSASSQEDKAREDIKNKKKAEIMKQLKAKLDEKKKDESAQKSLLDNLNLFLGTGRLSSETREKYYLDERFLEGGKNALFSEHNPFLEREQDNYVPEVLVIGATGEVGRLVVRRLLLDGKSRVRVLVRDLYSNTLNLLGTGVTYCQGDLGNVESLEYALTDVDKIVFCAGTPRPDEPDFQEKFQHFVKENLEKHVEQAVGDDDKKERVVDDMEWEQLDSILEVRAQLAEQVDHVGMQNLVRAYQNVRYADYGTSQAAKRSLFKFYSRPEDFDLFAVDEGNAFAKAGERKNSQAEPKTTKSPVAAYDYEEEENEIPDEDPYADYFDEDEEAYEGEYGSLVQRLDATVKAEVRWIRNEFGNGVFVGKVPKATSSGVSGEAAIVSSRLRSRDDPEKGIDLGPGFAGFIVRLVADGCIFEAFVRTGSYEEDGVEYVYEFSTETKPYQKSNTSRNKFMTARLPFENFKPVLKRGANEDMDDSVVEAFTGKDVRHIGFRYRGASNEQRYRRDEGENISFYMALSYVKVYREQPEPEFVYLSDARIPREVKNGMVRHDRRRFLSATEELGGNSEIVQILDQKALQNVKELARSEEETYFKFRGEETLKNSGLSYTIIRVSGFNEVPSGEASTIALSDSNDESISPVARDEVAQVCVSALLDPNALNKSIYMSKRQKGQRSSSTDENISAKFLALPRDLT